MKTPSLVSLKELIEGVEQELAARNLDPSTLNAGAPINEKFCNSYKIHGLFDPPDTSKGYPLYNVRHSKQLLAICLLLTQGTPPARIQVLVWGQSNSSLDQVIASVSKEREQAEQPTFTPVTRRCLVVDLNEEFTLVSKKGKQIPAETLSAIHELLLKVKTAPAGASAAGGKAQLSLPSI